MSEWTVPTTFQLRRGTSAEWAAANPVLAAGEPGVDTTTGEQRVGNGASTWSALPSVGATAASSAASAVRQEVAAAGYATVSSGGLPARTTQGLYQRTKPGPTGSATGLYGLANDPSIAGRVWVQGKDFAQLGFTDTNGATWTSKALPPAGGSAGVFDLTFAGGFAWLTQGPSAAKSGSLWRSPLPDAAGNGLSWTKVFDLAAPPGAITTGDNATFRNSCVAVNGANVYLLEYSVATITGGPSLYYSPDSGANWTKVKTWPNGKHGHAVRVINGLPWVTIGDAAFTDLGVWVATAANALVWNRRSAYGEAAGGNTLYGINMVPVTVGGSPMVAIEYDGSSNYGPLLFPSQTGTAARALIPTLQIPPAYFGTMRCLTLTSEGNLYWWQTTENGALGAHGDSVWMSQAPYTTAVCLESGIAASSMTLGNPVENGNYIWLGHFLIRKEKFAGQA